MPVEPVAVGSAERVHADPTTPWWAEHCSRYAYAAGHVRGARVLDVASGTGFGARMLADAGASYTVGCDLSVEALHQSRVEFGGERLAFVPADATVLPFRDEAFDVVVSFETIEHLVERDRFVGELRRVLKPGGMLFLSTPNHAITRAYARNPFHLHEYMRDELADLLRRSFASVTLFGQDLSARYRVAPFLPGHDTPHSFADRVRLLTWKICNRLPFAVKQSLSAALLGRSFYPSSSDYVFGSDFSRAHVLLAVCRRS
jgi:SAM-dependent methyltransferase